MNMHHAAMMHHSHHQLHDQNEPGFHTCTKRSSKVQLDTTDRKKSSYLKKQGKQTIESSNSNSSSQKSNSGSHSGSGTGSADGDHNNENQEGVLKITKSNSAFKAFDQSKQKQEYESNQKSKIKVQPFAVSDDSLGSQNQQIWLGQIQIQLIFWKMQLI